MKVGTHFVLKFYSYTTELQLKLFKYLKFKNKLWACKRLIGTVKKIEINVYRFELSNSFLTVWKK